jgi:hypothetical protein
MMKLFQACIPLPEGVVDVEPNEAICRMLKAIADHVVAYGIPGIDLTPARSKIVTSDGLEGGFGIIDLPDVNTNGRQRLQTPEERHGLEVGDAVLIADQRATGDIVWEKGKVVSLNPTDGFSPYTLPRFLAVGIQYDDQPDDTVHVVSRGSIIKQPRGAIGFGRFV